MAAVKQYGDSLQYASDDLKADKEVVITGVTPSRWAFKYASNALKADKEDIFGSK